jgi:hypothetical protein
MFTPKGSMSTEGETLQVSALPYRCSIAPFCCVCLGCCAAEFGSSGGTCDLPYTSLSAALQPISGLDRLVVDDRTLRHTHTHTVGISSLNDQLVAETDTCKTCNKRKTVTSMQSLILALNVYSGPFNWNPALPSTVFRNSGSTITL